MQKALNASVFLREVLQQVFERGVTVIGGTGNAYDPNTNVVELSVRDKNERYIQNWKKAFLKNVLRVLPHEATHAVDGSSGLLDPGQPGYRTASQYERHVTYDVIQGEVRGEIGTSIVEAQLRTAGGPRIVLAEMRGDLRRGYRAFVNSGTLEGLFTGWANGPWIGSGNRISPYLFQSKDLATNIWKAHQGKTSTPP